MSPEFGLHHAAGLSSYQWFATTFKPSKSSCPTTVSGWR